MPNPYEPGSLIRLAREATLPPPPPNPAKRMYHQLAKQIAEFEAQLDASQEVGVSLVSGPDNKPFHIDDLEYMGSDLIVFHGTNEHKRPVRLVQHVSQVNVLLTALPKESNEPRRIGFTLLKETKE
jgi:Family of unknown function (DUF6173)